jgi:hypothetical protein
MTNEFVFNLSAEFCQAEKEMSSICVSEKVRSIQNKTDNEKWNSLSSSLHCSPFHPTVFLFLSIYKKKGMRFAHPLLVSTLMGS